MSPSIRIALLDDHPAIRAGLEAMIAHEPDLDLVGAAASEAELWQLLADTQPDVVLVDLHHPGRDGLSICVQIKRQPQAPPVVVYSGQAEDAVLVAAVLAGAGAVVSKSSPASTLLDTIRVLARSPRTVPPVSRLMRREAAARLDPADRPILAMRLAGDPPADIGQTLRLPSRTIKDRIAAIIARLEPVGSAG